MAHVQVEEGGNWPNFVVFGLHLVEMAGGSWLPWWPKSWNPFSRWKYTSAYDYDTILASLAEEIEVVELTLMDIKARKRRAVSSVLQVLLMLWIGALAVLWGYASLAYTDEDYAWARSMFLLGLIVGTPVLLVVFHRLISLWFRRLEKAQETHLQALRKQRREKINEIKKATDFEHLRLLLERYDDETSVPEPSYTHADGAEHTSDAQSLRSKHSISSLRREPSRDSLRPGRPAESRHSRKPSEKGVPKLAPAITGMPIMGVPSAPPARGWMDKFADVILGTDPYGASLEDQQYALICRNCFRHNGLVPKNELNEIRTWTD